jgi:hypothetical protein
MADAKANIGLTNYAVSIAAGHHQLNALFASFKPGALG